MPTCLPANLHMQWCVLVPVVLTLIANQEPDDRVGKYIAKFCYPKWALEAFVTANAERSAFAFAAMLQSLFPTAKYQFKSHVHGV